MFCIWDDVNSPENLEGLSFIYWSKSFSLENSSFSITDILEKNSDRYKSFYLEFVLELGISEHNGKSVIDLLAFKPDFSFWWMTLIAQKNNWAKSPQINHILKLMVLEDWLNRNKCKKLFINTRNFELFRSISKLCKTKDIKLINLKKKNYFLSRLKIVYRNKFFYLFKSLFWLLRETVLSIPFAITPISIKEILKSKIILISYLSQNEIENDKELNSDYWGPLPSYINKNNISANWLYLPNRKLSFFKNLLFFKKIKEQQINQNNYFSISSFFSLTLLGEIFRNFLFIFRQSRLVSTSIKKESSYYWDLLNNDLKKSLFGPEMIRNLFYFSLFGRISKTMQASNLIYLYENQPWELSASYFFGKKVKKIYGFAHSTIRYWDLRYFNSQNIYKNNSKTLFPFFCDLIVHGKNDLRNMTEFGFPKEKIKEAESLRYIYLNKYLSDSTEHKMSNTFLVLGEYLRSDTKFMIDLLTSEKANEVLKNYKTIFKPHPLCPVKKSDFKDLNVEINFSDPGKLISQSDLVFVGNVSSVASEVITLGKQLICAKDLTLLDMSPLREYEGISFAVDSDSFLKELRKKTSVQKDTYQESILNLDESLKLWRNILKI